MSNDTTTPKKHCLSGDDCIHPDGAYLPLTEFYVAKNAKDGRQSRCKKCHYKQARTSTVQRGNQRTSPGHASETLVISQLRNRGIYATSGKSSEFKSLDVVAWGCVRIECKSSTKDKDGKYLFKFDSQRVNGIQGDLVVLICQGDGEPTFHVFPAKHSVFYRDGQIKRGLGYDPLNTKRKYGNGLALSAALMNQHKDKWEQIEEKRLEVVRNLLAGTYQPERVVSGMEQMKLAI